MYYIQCFLFAKGRRLRRGMLGVSAYYINLNR